MAEYIKLEPLRNEILNDTDPAYDSDTINHFLGIVDSQPTADVVEVKHGEWQEIDNLVIEHGLPTVKGKTWRCSICGEARKNRTAPDMNYCPNCGAKMDLKEGAEE